MKQLSSFSFRGFYAGSVAAAVLLSYGIELLVATARDPLAAWAIDAINFIIRVGRFDVPLLYGDHFFWAVPAYTGVSGFAVLLVGIRLAAWVSKEAAKEFSQRH